MKIHIAVQGRDARVVAAWVSDELEVLRKKREKEREKERLEREKQLQAERERREQQQERQRQERERELRDLRERSPRRGRDQQTNLDAVKFMHNYLTFGRNQNFCILPLLI